MEHEIFYTPIDELECLCKKKVYNDDIISAILEIESPEYKRVNNDDTKKALIKGTKNIIETIIFKKYWEEHINDINGKHCIYINIKKYIHIFYMYIKEYKSNILYSKISNYENFTSLFKKNIDEYDKIFNKITKEKLIEFFEYYFEKEVKYLDYKYSLLYNKIEDKLNLLSNKIEKNKQKLFTDTCLKILKFSYNKTYEEYTNENKEITNEDLIYTLSNKFDKNIFILNSEYIPERVIRKDNFEYKTFSILLYKKNNKYQLIGKPLSDKNIQFVFDKNNLLIDKIYSFLYDKNKLETKYPYLLYYME